MISDEIWVRLDPGAGMVRRIGYGRWFLAGIAAMLAAAAWVSGAISPRLSPTDDGGGGHTSEYKDEIGRPKGIEATVNRTFVNEGWLPLTISRIGVPADDAYVLQEANPDEGGGLPRTIASGEEMTIELVVAVADCAAVKGPVPVVFEVERWWGRATVEVDLNGGEAQWLSSVDDSACGDALRAS